MGNKFSGFSNEDDFNKNTNHNSHNSHNSHKQKRENLKKATNEIEQIIIEFSHYAVHVFSPVQNYAVIANSDNNRSEKENWCERFGYDNKDILIDFLWENNKQIDKAIQKIIQSNGNVTSLLYPFVNFFVEKIIRACQSNQLSITDDAVKSIIQTALSHLPEKIGRFIGKYYEQHNWCNAPDIARNALSFIFTQLEKVCTFFQIESDEVLKNFGQRVGKAIDLKIKAPSSLIVMCIWKNTKRLGLGQLPRPLIQHILSLAHPNCDSEEEFSKININNKK